MSPFMFAHFRYSNLWLRKIKFNAVTVLSHEAFVFGQPHSFFPKKKETSDKTRIVVSDMIKYLSTQILCHFPFGTRPTFQLAAFAGCSPKFCAPSLSLTFQRSCCSWWQIVTLYQEDLRYNCTNIGETVSAIRACTITRLRPLPFEAWEAHPIHWKLMLSLNLWWMIWKLIDRPTELFSKWGFVCGVVLGKPCAGGAEVAYRGSGHNKGYAHAGSKKFSKLSIYIYV